MTTLPIVHVNTMTTTKTWSETATDFMDGYFTLSNKKAVVIPHEVSEAGSQVVIELTSEEATRLGLSEGFLKKMFKIISYCTLVFPAIVWIAQKLYHRDNSFKVVSVNNELNVTNQRLLELVQIGNNPKGKITRYPPTNHVFSTTDAPGFIFKNRGENRAVNARFAQIVCRIYDLGLLKIPRMTNIHPYTIEEMFPCHPNRMVQQERYKQFGEALDKAILQLAFFILMTGYNDVKHVNNPVLEGNDFIDSIGNRHIALVDTEHMETSKGGLIGCRQGGKGLIRLISVRQGKMVCNAVRKWRPALVPEIEKSLEESTNEQQEAAQLEDHHTRHGIKPNTVLNTSALTFHQDVTFNTNDFRSDLVSGAGEVVKIPAKHATILNAAFTKHVNEQIKKNLVEGMTTPEAVRLIFFSDKDLREMCLMASFNDEEIDLNPIKKALDFLYYWVNRIKANGLAYGIDRCRNGNQVQL